MNIDIKDTLTLSDKNKYLVVGKINYIGNTYYYLVDELNHENIKFCLEKTSTNSLVEVINTSLIEVLIPLFAEAGKNHISMVDLEG